MIEILEGIFELKLTDGLLPSVLVLLARIYIAILSLLVALVVLSYRDQKVDTTFYMIAL